MEESDYKMQTFETNHNAVMKEYKDVYSSLDSVEDDGLEIYDDSSEMDNE